MKRWKAIFLELMEWGVDPGSTPGEQKHVRYTNAASILALLLTILFFVFETPIIADWGTLGPREALILGFRFAASFLFIIPPLLNRRGLPSASRLFFGVCAVLFTIGLTWLYGSAAPSHLFFIAIVAAFIAIFPARERVTMWFILGLCLAGFGLSLFLRYSAQPLVTIQRPEIRIVVDVMVSLGAIALVLALSLAQRSANDAAEAAVVAQREKADRLLLNILPEPIAERLKANPGAIADGFDEVTVMFADLVGFTVLSQTMSPRDLVELMDQVFSQFDAAAERHGLEKIKTIGDAYMVAGGIPVTRPDHAEAIASMALDLLPIVDAMETPLQIRVGIATGPAVAGVIGKKKFAYDLWGDTVNTASRMESHSEAGRIQVSEPAYLRLRHRFEFTERGLVSIKGKGEMKTWYLTGDRMDRATA